LFTGGVYGKAKHLKYDSRTYMDNTTGIRYKWLFLAKSHVAKKSSSTDASGSNCFGCIFCVDEGKETAVFGTAATLMSHISTEHKKPGEEIAARNKCIVGQGVTMAEWDIQLP
jgi:hypothetical protein